MRSHLLAMVFLVLVTTKGVSAEVAASSPHTPETIAPVVKSADHAIISFYSGRPTKRTEIVVKDTSWFDRLGTALASTQYSRASPVFAIGTSVTFFDENDKAITRIGLVLGVLSLDTADYELPKESAAKIRELLREQTANQASEPTPPSVTPRADARVAPVGGVVHL